MACASGSTPAPRCCIAKRLFPLWSSPVLPVLVVVLKTALEVARCSADVIRCASSCFAVYQTAPHFGNQAAMVGFASGRRPYGFASSTFVDFAFSRSVGGSRVHQRARSRSSGPDFHDRQEAALHLALSWEKLERNAEVAYRWAFASVKFLGKVRLGKSPKGHGPAVPDATRQVS
jgi:hypothetical protein